MGGPTLTLPVVLALWELECCQPHATVGDEWSAMLVMAVGDPWWIQYATEPVSDDVRNLGVVDVEGVVLRPAEAGRRVGLVAAGPVRFTAAYVTAGQHSFRGVMHHEAHGGGGDDLFAAEVECVGTVRRIQGVSYRYEERPGVEEGIVPVAQEPPVELTSTDGARKFSEYLLTIEFQPGAVE
jgi:hypothetical protein